MSSQHMFGNLDMDMTILHTMSVYTNIASAQKTMVSKHPALEYRDIDTSILRTS